MKNIWNAAKTARENFMAVNAYIKKKDISKPNLPP